ncbi:uncharacterized protein [Parasteatoda tepidariorum]|uniref:uncharacterized protein n=1 Tax=Parasteatoda tepidariorum TaxID=114398 RepID=UPI0039BC4A45
MLLPCKHIFSVRLALGMSLYEENLVNKRWTTSYNIKHHRVFENDMSSYPTEIKICSKPKVVARSKQEKYKESILVTNELADVISETTGSRYAERLELIREIINHWKSNNGIKISVTESPSTATLTDIEKRSPDDPSNFLNSNVGVPEDLTSKFSIFT